jgi:hypothetical protein
MIIPVRCFTCGKVRAFLHVHVYTVMCAVQRPFYRYILFANIINLTFCGRVNFICSVGKFDGAGCASGLLLAFLNPCERMRDITEVYRLLVISGKRILGWYLRIILRLKRWTCWICEGTVADVC